MKKGCLSYILWIGAIALTGFFLSKMYGGIVAVTGVVLLLIIAAILYRNAIYVIAAQMTFDKDHAKGFKWFDKAYKTGRMKPQEALFYAYLLLRDGHTEKSAAIIDEIGRQRKSELSRQDYLNSRLNRALITWKSGDLDGAIESIQAIYDEDFKNTAVYGVLGYLYIEKGDYEKAMTINEEAVDYNPDDNIISDNYALNYLRMGDIEKAEELYKNLLEKNPNFLEPYYNYATLLEQKGDIASSKEYYHKALEYPEKYLSTVSHSQITSRLDNLG